MRNRIAIAELYANLYKDRAKKVVVNTKKKAVENKSELTCIAVTTVVVGLTARVAGFKAGYAFATNNQIANTV